MDLQLPAVNAALNATATVLLVWGRVAIAQGKRELHQRLMLGAFGVSALFLVCYVAHKVGKNFENTTYNAVGLAKTLYLAMLASHVVLASVVPLLAILLIRWGLRGELDRHRRLARFAWPIWMYVSVTGVLIYFLLYHWNPATPLPA